MKQYLIKNNNQPLYPFDVWWPVSNGPNQWVSVGNCDPDIRLGNEHCALFGPPGWGNT